MALGDEYSLDPVPEADAPARDTRYEEVLEEGRQLVLEEWGETGEYLEDLAMDPEMARNAPQRVADMLKFYGSTYDSVLGMEVYDLFTEDPLHDGQYALHDEDVFEAVGRFVVTAGASLGAGRVQRLPLPDTATGKKASYLLQRYFEEYTRREEGRMRTFRWTDLADMIPDQPLEQDTVRSPLNQDPVALVSASRRRFWDDLNQRHDRSYMIQNDQHLDAESAFYREHLLDHYDGDMKAVLRNHIEIVPAKADHEKARLLDTVDLSPRKAYDAAELVGGIDWENIARYGERDPRAFAFDGGVQHANRGILRVENLADTATEGLYDFEMAVDEGRTKPAYAPSMDIDQVIITHGPTHSMDVLVSERHYGYR